MQRMTWYEECEYEREKLDEKLQEEILVTILGGGVTIGSVAKQFNIPMEAVCGILNKHIGVRK